MELVKRNNNYNFYFIFFLNFGQIFLADSIQGISGGYSGHIDSKEMMMELVNGHKDAHNTSSRKGFSHIVHAFFTINIASLRTYIPTSLKLSQAYIYSMGLKIWETSSKNVYITTTILIYKRRSIYRCFWRCNYLLRRLNRADLSFNHD